MASRGWKGLKLSGTQHEGWGTNWNNRPQLATQAKIRMCNIPNAKQKGSLRHPFYIRLTRDKNRRTNQDRHLIFLLHETEKEGPTRTGG